MEGGTAGAASGLAAAGTLASLREVTSLGLPHGGLRGGGWELTQHPRDELGRSCELGSPALLSLERWPGA